MPDKTAAVIALLVCTSAFTTNVARQPAVPPDNFFDSNGVRIRYVDQGQGFPVVLIHGYTGTLERHWINSGVFTHLAGDHRVIALDCRGHGKSDKPIDPKRYGAEMSQDIVRLLDRLSIPRAHIVGFSMGAIIAGHLLTTNPDRFITATFVGYHPVHKWSTDDEREVEASARDLESDTPFRLLILGVSPPDAPPSEEEIRKLSQRLVAANDTKALAAYHRGRRTLVVTDTQLNAVRVPTLGIIGSADPSIAGMQDLKRVMPSLKIVIVDGAEHGGERGILRRPEFLATLRDFLKDQAGGAAPAQRGNLLISDFDGEKIEIRSGLSLWIFADEQFGGTSEAQPTLVRPGADASRGALRISFRITEDFANPFAGVWAMVGPEGLATDLSAYRGVRFYARSKHEGGAFTAGVVRFPGQLKRYMTRLETRPEWTLVELPFDTFREVTPAGAPAAGAPSLVAYDITSIGFSVAPNLRGQFELDIDRIEFYR